jgi:hypothetical protein
MLVPVSGDDLPSLWCRAGDKADFQPLGDLFMATPRDASPVDLPPATLRAQLLKLRNDTPAYWATWSNR